MYFPFLNLIFNVYPQLDGIANVLKIQAIDLRPIVANQSSFEIFSNR